ncbi:MAG: polysaccharide biosynthesis/export family protein [Planctomycetota bacterium]|nr:polysaccharide biosynthesis/export family protein [Planctomycetota bacterium]
MSRPVLLCVPLFLAACASDPPAMLVPETGSVPALARAAEYHVGPGDVLRVNVFGHPELGSQVVGSASGVDLVNNAIGGTTGTPVDGSGYIQLPLIGPVAVNGMSLLRVRDAVTCALERYLKEPKVDVSVIRFGSQRFIVLGEAKNPGVYTLERSMTALEAIAMAGGYSESANRKQLIWMRGGLGAENLVLLDGSGLDASAAQRVEHGDVLFVGRRPWADRAEALRDVVPVLQTVTIPLSIAAQFVTLEKLLND